MRAIFGHRLIRREGSQFPLTLKFIRIDWNWGLRSVAARQDVLGVSRTAQAAPRLPCAPFYAKLRPLRHESKR
jgi:hypothetical protein